MTGRESERIGVLLEVRESEGLCVADEQPQDAVTLGLVSDAGARLVVDPDGHELDEMLAVGPDDPQGPVLRVGEPARPFDDGSEHRGEIEPHTNREHRLEQHPEAIGGRRDDHRPLLELAEQIFEPKVGGGELGERRQTLPVSEFGHAQSWHPGGPASSFTILRRRIRSVSSGGSKGPPRRRISRVGVR